MKTVRLLLFLAFPIAACSQDSLKLHAPVSLYGLVAYDIPKGFGFTLGASFPFHSAINAKNGFQKNEIIFSELGAYRYPNVYTSIFFDAGVGIQYIQSAKHFSELLLSQGLLRTAYDGKVYEVDQNGNIKERTLFGRTYFITQFSYSLNYGLYKRHSNLWFIKLRPSAWLQYPYNSFVKLHFSVQAGVTYCFKNRGFS